jgi:hypothetical protein
VPVEVGWGSLVELICPIGQELFATAEVRCIVATPDRLPVVVTGLRVGVGYEPLRRLWPLLGQRYRLSVISEPVWPAEKRGGHGDLVRVATQADAVSGVAQLVDLIGTHAVAFAEQRRSVGLLLESLQDDRSRGVDQRVVALLAAAGRLQEAGVGLARYRAAVSDGPEDRRNREFIRQMARYLDSGADPDLIPDPPAVLFSDPPRLSWAQQRQRSDSQRAAVHAVEELAPNLDRGSQRAALERELDARGLTESPLWIEQTLDNLQRSSTERAVELGKGVASVTRLGFRIIRGLSQHRSFPDLSPPKWLERPDHAAYRMTQSSDARWVAVLVTEDANAWLADAYAATPRLFGPSAVVYAWLDWDQPRSSLAVWIGERRVGTLDSGATEIARAAMETAARRAELPYVAARLTPRPSQDFLLELPLPPKAP